VSGWRWYLKMVPPRAFYGSARASRAAETRRPMRIGPPRARGPPAPTEGPGRAPKHDRVLSGFPRPQSRRWASGVHR
jgi:hypothetical protein